MLSKLELSDLKLSSAAFAMASLNAATLPGNHLVTQQRKKQPLSRVAEEALHHMANLGPARLMLPDAWAIDIGSALLPVLDVAFLFKDPDCGQYGVVGERSITVESQQPDRLRPILRAATESS